MDKQALHQRLVEYEQAGKDAVLITAVDKRGEGPVKIGIKLLVGEDGELIGTVGGGALEHHAIEEARRILKTRENKMETYLLNEDAVTVERAKEKSLPMVCGGKVTLFYEFIGAMSRVYLYGAGHVSRALGRVLKTMPFHLSVIDDREAILEDYPYADEKHALAFAEHIEREGIREGSFVVVCTPNHKQDYHVINKILELDLAPRYIGLLCSPTKLKDYLKKTYETFGEDVDLTNLYAPVGLDTGGGSPEEIAISVAAEMLAIHYDKPGHRHLRETLDDPYRYWED